MSTVEKSAVSRRKVAAGIAWSVPVIAAASVAPFAAASPTKCVILSTPPGGGTAPCGSNGQIIAKFTHNTNDSGGSLELYLSFQVPAGITIPVGGQVTFLYTFAGQGDLGTPAITQSAGGFDLAASKPSPSTVLVTATAGTGGVTGTGTNITVVLTVPLSNISGAGTVAMTATTTAGATGCGVSAPYSKSLPLRLRSADGITGVDCTTGSGSGRVRYYYA